MSFTINALGELWTSKTEVGKRTGTVVWQITSDTPTTPAAAEAALVVASKGQIGSVYPGEANDSSLRCISRDVEAQGQTRAIFRATCEYDNTITYNANPLDDLPDFDWSGENNDESFFKDQAEPAKYAQTTAYEPFPDLPKRQACIAVCNYSRNVASTATFASYYPYTNKVNSGGVTIDGVSFDDGQVLVGVPSLSAVKQRDGYSYKVLSGQVRARPDGWDQKYESRGMVELDTGYQFPITDNEGTPVTSPWPLDASGAKKSSQSDTGADILLKPYKRTDISGLFG